MGSQYEPKDIVWEEPKKPKDIEKELEEWEGTGLFLLKGVRPGLLVFQDYMEESENK